MAITAIPGSKGTLSKMWSAGKTAAKRVPQGGVNLGAAAGLAVGGIGVPKKTAAATPTTLAPVNMDFSGIDYFPGLTSQGFAPTTQYTGEITSDPEYMLGQTNLTNLQGQLAQARANAFRQGLIKSGFAGGAFQAALANDPTLAQFAGDIDPASESAAAANQMSVKAQLDRSLADAQAALPYQLAARGVQRSGAAAARSGQFQRSYNEQSAGALSSLLDTLRGTAGDYTSRLAEAANEWEKTKLGVTRRLAETPGVSQPTPDPGAGYNPFDFSSWGAGPPVLSNFTAEGMRAAIAAQQPKKPAAKAKPPAAKPKAKATVKGKK